MADIGLFDSHYDSFVFSSKDLTGEGEKGKSSGIVNVKGFTSDTELLTSRGWMLFDDLHEVLLEEKIVWERFVALRESYRELGKLSEFVSSETLFDPILVATVSPYAYDEVKKEQVFDSGEVFFTQPTGFHHWVFNRLIVRTKLRGIDIRMSQYAEVVGKKKFRDEYSFIDGNTLYENQYEEYFYLLLNKFSKNIGETYNPKLFGDKLASYKPREFIRTNVHVVGRGAEVYPSEYVTRYSGYLGDIYNVTVPPYGSLIIRKEREKTVSGDVSERPWVGKPVVVGDASNKFVFAKGFKTREG